MAGERFSAWWLGAGGWRRACQREKLEGVPILEGELELLGEHLGAAELEPWDDVSDARKT